MIRASIVAIFVAIGLAGCAPRGVESPIEKAPPAEIERARQLVSNGDVVGARRAYEGFLASHPGTVEADLARLELGILEAASVGCERAMPHFQQAQDSKDPALALRASLRVASCQAGAREAEAALETLAPIAAERFTDAEQALLWDTTITAAEQTLDAPLGLRVIDTVYVHGGPPRDPQRAADVVGVLVLKLAIEQAAVSFEELAPGGVPQRAVARRMLEHGLSTQDADLVARATDALRDGPAAEDPETRLWIARGDEFLHGNPFVVGALLPLSGRGREVGQQLLQGMQLAALHEGGPELIVEDTGGDPDTTTRAVEALIGDQRVVAVLGPVGGRTTEAAAEATQRTQVPLLTYSAAEAATQSGPHVFRALYSPRDELRALVRSAGAQGGSRYVILYPDHGYGRTLQRIFGEEVAAAGASSCASVPYPPGTRSFVEYVQVVLEGGCDVVLLADTSTQVASIAPTFAAEGAWSAIDGRIRFLLPSPSWSSALLGRAGRYLQGSLVVVPFYAESEASTNTYFYEAYQDRYGRPPQTFAAYGYDTYRMIATTLRLGFQTRAALLDALRAGTAVTPVTSLDRFSDDRVPAAASPVYEIRGTVLELQPR